MKALLARTGHLLASQALQVSVVATVFAVWAGAFIRRTSVVSAAFGGRYYCLFDDAMISMRYAWNLSHGLGLVWNPGESVEGFTNLLMTLYMSVATALFDKSNAVLAIQVSGVAFLLLMAFATMAVGNRLLVDKGRGDLRSLGPLFFAAALAFYPLDYWALMGMENGLLAALLAAALWQAMRIDPQPRPSLALAVLLGLSFLTRPDAAIAIALILLFRLSGVIGKDGGRAAVALEAGVVAAFIAGVTVFRYAYYGNPLPNTYYLKLSGMPLADRIGNGLAFTGPFLALVALPLAICGVGLVRRFSRRSLLVLGLVLSSIAYQIDVGGDAFEGWRMMAGSVPLVLVSAIVELVAFTASFSGGGRRWPVAVAASAVVGLACLLNRGYGEEITLRAPAHDVRANRKNVRLGLAIGEVTTENATVGVTWAGAIPYYSERRGVDFLGKSDPYIASLPPDLSGSVSGHGMSSLPGHNKYDLQYSIVKRAPTFVQESQWGSQDLGDYVHGHYRWVRFAGVGMWLMRDSPDVRWDRIGSAAGGEER